jgi:hypothetical protein
MGCIAMPMNFNDDWREHDALLTYSGLGPT